MSENGNQTFCICHPGWATEACDVCRPYWECPNQGADSCELPNECLCSDETLEDSADAKGLCNNELLVTN
jgi:hypothetical protein